MKVQSAAKRRMESRNGHRRYTLRDMAIIKHDESILNAREKRGEIRRQNNRKVIICGCGVEGCFLHNSYDVDDSKRLFENFRKK